jgi:hypothetical protein
VQGRSGQEIADDARGCPRGDVRWIVLRRHLNDVEGIHPMLGHLAHGLEELA